MASDPNHDAVPPVERLIELAVFAPLSAGARVLTEAPRIAERIRQDLATARFLGRMAVTQGAQRLRDRIEEPAPPTAPPPTPADAPAALPAADDDVPPVGALALPDYDHLPAVDIVAALSTLDPDERAAIARYERAHRARRTVLGKVEQLDAAS